MEDLGWVNSESNVGRQGAQSSRQPPLQWPFTASEPQALSPGESNSIVPSRTGTRTSTSGQTPQSISGTTQYPSTREVVARQQEMEASPAEQDFDPLPSQLVVKDRGAAKQGSSPAGQTGSRLSSEGGNPRSGIDLGLGFVLPIPPLYDELAKGKVWPSLEELSISDEVLKGAITTVTLASLKNATLEKQMGKPWACFSKGSLGYDPYDFKPLSFWTGDADEDTNAASWFHSDWAFQSEKSPKKTSKKRGRSAKPDGAGSERKKRAASGTAKGSAPPSKPSTPPVAEEENSMLGEQEAKPEKSEEVTKHKKRENKFVEGWETLEFDKITSKQRSILKKAAETNPDIRERLEASEARKHWGLMIRRDLPKTYKAWQTASRKQVQDARKLAEICRREVRQRAARNAREAAKATHAMKKMCRDMLTFWRKADREAADIKKQEEKAAAEQRKREEEETEQRRQAQKLNFLLNKTELYSHFMANKLGGESAAGLLPTPVPDDEEDAALLKQAKVQAEAAVASTAERMIKFDKDYQKAHEKAGGSGSSLINPSSMPSTSKVQQPKGFKGKLKEYQLRGLQWLVNLYEKGLNGILADEMGLGKTIQAIAFMAHLAEDKNIWGPFLVVAPSSTLHNWDSELTQFFPSFKVLPYWGSQQDRKVLRQSFNPRKMYSKEPPFNVTVTSYQLLIQDEAYLKRPKWQYMILDEAQAIKSSSSVRWKTLLSFSCRNRILLTGTPIQNNLAELWALLHFIMPTLFDSMEQFNDWFSKGLEQFAEGSHELNKEQLKRLHSLLSPFMLRRVKSDVAGEMVSKHEKVVFCELSRRQRMLYKALRENLNLAHLFDSDEKVINLMNLVIQLRKVCNHPELFEEQSERVPLHFAHQACPLSPAAFGSLSWVYYSGNRPELAFQLPKLVYREGLLSGQSALADWQGIFRSKWLHNRLCIFRPENVLESMGEGGCFGFVGLSGLSPNEVHFMSAADPLQRWIRQQQEHRNNRVAAEFWERHWTVNSGEQRAYALRTRRILLVDVHAATDALQDIPELADCVGCGPLIRGVEERMLSMLDILKRLRPGFVEPVLAPVPALLCSDRNFASRLQFWASSVWLRPLLFGSTPVNTNAVQLTAGAPSAIREVTSRVLSDPPGPGLLSSLHRAFGSAPAMQQYALAKALVDSGKMFKLDELLRKLKAAGHRVLLFSQMTMMMNILADYLNFRRYRYLRLDGQSSISDRRDMVNAFQQDPKIFVFLLSTRAGGLGINLTAADTVIFFESDWNPTMDLQAMDRAHRLGQTRDVTVYRLICRGTIEEKILQRAKEKKTVQQLVMTGQASKGDLFAPEEMVSLLLEEGESPVAINRYGRKASKATTAVDPKFGMSAADNMKVASSTMDKAIDRSSTISSPSRSAPKIFQGSAKKRTIR